MILWYHLLPLHSLSQYSNTNELPLSFSWSPPMSMFISLPPVLLQLHQIIVLSSHSLLYALSHSHEKPLTAFCNAFSLLLASFLSLLWLFNRFLLVSMWCCCGYRLLHALFFLEMNALIFNELYLEEGLNWCLA
jgi:hypothetical protein